MIDLRWLPRNFSRNILSLYGAQLTGYVLPLITIPYIVRVIGPERYGMVAIAMAVVQYFLVLGEYGYNFTGPRDVARKRDDKTELVRYVNRMFWTRAFLVVSSLCVSILSLAVFPLNPHMKLLVLYSFGVVVGKMLFLHPVFLGLERAKTLAMYSIGGGILGVLMIFTFIRHPSDYLLLPLVYSAVSIATGCASLFISVRRLDIRLHRPVVSDVISEIRTGFRVFTATGMISIYVVGNTLILGLFAPAAVVGWYAAGEKLVRMAQGVFVPIQNLLFPEISRLVHNSPGEALDRLRRSVGLVAPIGIGISFFVIVLAPNIVGVAFGEEFAETVNVVRVLGAIPLIMSMTLLFADTYLLGFGYQNYWSAVILSAGVISVVISLILVAWLDMQHIGSSISLLATEVFVLVAAYIKYRFGTNIAYQSTNE